MIAESSDSGSGADGEDVRSVGSKTGSVKDIKRILNSVTEDMYEERHLKMINELRIRKMLAQEKIKYPTNESFEDRKIELMKLYSTLQDAVTAKEQKF